MKNKMIGTLLMTVLLVGTLPVQGSTLEPQKVILDEVQLALLQGGEMTATCAGAIIFLVGEATFGAALAATGNVVGAAWWLTRMMGESLAVVGACA